MEKKKTKIKKIDENSNIVNKEERVCIEEMRIHGFQSSMEVARTLMGSIHENLLRGDLVFAYTSSRSSSKTSLYQVVVVNDLYELNGTFVKSDKYSISLITSGYSAYIPHMPIDYLTEIAKDLEENKVDKKVIESFKKIITNNLIGGHA